MSESNDSFEAAFDDSKTCPPALTLLDYDDIDKAPAIRKKSSFIDYQKDGWKDSSKLTEIVSNLKNKDKTT